MLRDGSSPLTVRHNLELPDFLLHRLSQVSKRTIWLPQLQSTIWPAFDALMCADTVVRTLRFEISISLSDSCRFRFSTLNSGSGLPKPWVGCGVSCLRIAATNTSLLGLWSAALRQDVLLHPNHERANCSSKTVRLTCRRWRSRRHLCETQARR